MNTQFSAHDDEAREHAEPATNPDEAQDALTSAGEAAGTTEHVEDIAPGARKKRAARTPSAGGQARRKRTRENGIIELHVPTRAADAALDAAKDESAREELVAQGFTTDEAARIVDLSVRLGSSREARDAEASLRRLRFTRWLVERGVLDEFSA